MDGKNGPEQPEKCRLSRRDLIKTVLTAAAAGTALPSREARADSSALTVSPVFYPVDPFTPEIDLTGKVIVITGASRGLGKATGLALNALGGVVIGTSRNVNTVPDPPPYPLVDLDIARPESVDGFAHRLSGILGGRKVDVLINNAARGTWGYVSNRILSANQRMDYHFHQLRLATETVYHGHVAVTQAVMPLMPISGYARILFTVTSMQYFAGGGGTVFLDFLQAYLSSKRALYVYANTLRMELLALGSNIKVSTVNPMVMHTELMEDLRPIYLEATDRDGMTGDGMRDGMLYGMRQALAYGLDPSFVGNTYAQLLRMSNPPPNVAAGSAAEPYATQGLYNAMPSQMFAENDEAGIRWVCA